MVARDAGVKSLYLFHHDFMATDEDVALNLEDARRIFPHTFTAHDGLVVRLENS
jgi:ribonuclease BN (tRNA processing enzyme)